MSSEFKPFTEEEKDKIKVYYLKDRLSIRKIAEKLNRPYNSIRNVIKNTGLAEARRKNDDLLVTKILREINTDLVKGTAHDLNLCTSYLALLNRRLEIAKTKDKVQEFYDDLTMKEIGFLKLFTENIRKIHAIAKFSKEGEEINKSIEKIAVEFTNGYVPELLKDDRFIRKISPDEIINDDMDEEYDEETE